MALWYIVIGSLLIVMVLAGTLLKRLPLTTAILYLLVGYLLSRGETPLLHVDVERSLGPLLHCCELVLLISLFSAGLKLRTPLLDRRWLLPARLATLSMLLTIALVALLGRFGLMLPAGAAILLGAILAPTDPVLASEVQMEHPWDRDRLRFSLTGEAGFNDGSALPFMLLGLGLLGLHPLGPAGRSWLLADLLWNATCGLLVGLLLGTLVGRLVLFLRRQHKEAAGLDDFLALGLIGLSYGIAERCRGAGFLAVFAAGLALRRIERVSATGADPPVPLKALPTAAEVTEVSTHPTHAPAYMAQALLGWTEQLERMGEVVVVLLCGGMLATVPLRREAWWLVPLLLFAIRPLSVYAGLLGAQVAPYQRNMMAWFGIRGIGSIYYLLFARHHGVPEPQWQVLAGVTLPAVAVSIVVHGISVTPLMNLYERARRRRLRGVWPATRGRSQKADRQEVHVTRGSGSAPDHHIDG